MLEASLFLGLAGLAIGLLLALAAKKFKVEEDPRVEAIISALPGANCGGCGYPGCAGYASAVAEGKAPIISCIVGGNSVAERISEIMGVAAGAVTPSIAVVYCQGDNEQAVKTAEYSGITDCLALNMLGGNKECTYGCLGLGSCVTACPFDAMYMSEKGLPVVIPEKCTGCGLCVKACPRGVIGIVPVDMEVHVRCRSYDKGPVVRKYCKVGCIACTACVRACPQKAITMDKGTLAKIDYSICDNCGICSTKCPVKTISHPKKAQEKAS
jgi:electron transport complex protein RnfB